jgi:nucleotide-binding universal stress UspA family protein
MEAVIFRKERKSMNDSLKIQRILFATDLLENSRLALDYAVAFSEHFNASIHMLHVVQLSGAAHAAELETHRGSVSRLAAEERLNVLAAGVRRLGLRVEAEVVDGLTCEMILKGVVSHQADLLVLGVHGVHRGVEHLLIGSNTEKIMLSVTCPILTVGAHVLTGFDVKLHVKEIVLFSDFTADSASAAPYALMLGREFGLPVDVCQLLPVVAEGNERLKKQLAEDYCQSMKKVLDDDQSIWCQPAFQLKRGMQLDQIIDRAKSQQAGLIVLGAHTESMIGRHLHSSFAYQILGRATCPVFTIPRLQ